MRNDQFPGPNDQAMTSYQLPKILGPARWALRREIGHSDILWSLLLEHCSFGEVLVRPLSVADSRFPEVSHD